MLDETVTITADSKGVFFEVSGEAGSGKIALKQSNFAEVLLFINN